MAMTKFPACVDPDRTKDQIAIVCIHVIQTER